MKFKKVKSTSLCDLPAEVINEITSKLESFYRFSVRKVNQKLRASIDNQDYGIKTVGYNVSGIEASLELDNYQVKYKLIKGFCQLRFGRSLDANSLHRSISKASPFELILIDLTIFLTNPKVKLQKLIVNITVKGKSRQIHFDALENVLKLMKCHVSGVEFLNCSSSEAAPLLACFKVKEFVHLSFGNIEKLSGTLFQLEQWKQAKSLTIQSIVSLELLPVNQLVQFHLIEVTMNLFSKKDVEIIMQVVERSKNFEHARITVHQFNLRKAEKHFENYKNDLQCDIPVIIQFDEHGITIEAKNVQRTVFKPKDSNYHKFHISSFTPSFPNLETPYRLRRQKILEYGRSAVVENPITRSEDNNRFQDEKMKTLVAVLKTDKHALRACILYDYLKNEPVEEAYDVFCETVGESSMGYREFEFWSQEIAQGTFELESCLCSDAVSRLRFPQRVINMILSKARPIDRFVLWKVSGGFQPNILSGVQNFRVLIHNRSVRLEMDQDSVKYKDEEIAQSDANVKIEKEKSNTWQVSGGNLAMTLNDLKLMLDGSELQFSTFKLEVDQFLPFKFDFNDYMKEGKNMPRWKIVKNAFDSMNCVPANCVDGYKFEGVIPIVPCPEY